MLAPLTFCLLLSTLAQAVNVYLAPAPSHLRSTLTPEDASAALSYHLGLEVFETLRDASDLSYNEESFVGKGEKNALVITVEESDADAILPYSIKPTFTLETPPLTPVFSLTSVITTYLHRASHSFTSIFPSTGSSQPEDVDAFVSFFKDAQEPAFAAVDLTELHAIGNAHGRTSDTYTQVADRLRAILEQLIEDDRFNIAVLTFTTHPSTSLAKRQTPQQTQVPLPSTAPPQQPIGSVSTCFTSADVCNNKTTICSGRGQCVEASKAGRTCFVCNCGVTKTGEGSKVKTDYWAGESCERKDVSGPFVLLTGTVIVIILLIVGSVSLLYTVGDQPLPSTLLATAVHVKHE